MPSVAQEQAGRAEPLSIGWVALAVRDLETSARFYERVVGLEQIERYGEQVRLGVAGSLLLELRRRPDLLSRDPAEAGLYHNAFLLPSRADLGRWLAHAAALGLILDGAADHLVSEAVYLHDPEGNGIEIYADRPREDWRWTQSGPGPERFVEMANNRLDMIGLRALAQGAWEGAPVGTRIGHVHLQVGDVRLAEEFYAGQIGLDVTRRLPGAVFLSSRSYHHHLAANTWHSAGAGARDPNRAGLDSLTFVASPDALDGIVRRTGVADLLGAGLRDPWGTQLRFQAG